MGAPEDKWDAFLSYASEDRDSIAVPLYQLLTGFGLRIWFDQTQLNVGDSLRERIDAGLAHSRYGICLFSPHFFAKHYPQRELNGLAAREVDGEKIVLPVWHEVDARVVREYSPPLADRKAVLTSDGLDVVVSHLVPVIRPDLIDAIREEMRAVRPLPEISTGKQIVDVYANSHAHQEFIDEVSTQEEAELVGGFQEWLREVSDFTEDLSATQVLSMQLELSAELERLRSAGWKLFGERRDRMVKFPTGDSVWRVAIVAIVKNARGAATVKGGNVIVLREDPGAGKAEGGSAN